MNHETLAALVGWISTAVLFVTLMSQIIRQWSLGRADEISPALFLGQCAASVGFLAYSAMVGSVIFIVSNALILGIALAGECVRQYLLRHPRDQAASPSATRTA